MVDTLETRDSLEDPSVPLRMALTGGASSSSVVVNKQTSLGYPAVFRGVNLIANAVAKTPVHVFKRLEDGSKERDKSHPAEKFLRNPSTDPIDRFHFRKSMMLHSLLGGNSYVLLIRNGAGDVIDSHMFEHDSVRIRVRPDGSMRYEGRLSGQALGKGVDASPENVLHIKGLSSDGVVGFSVVDLLREAIGLGMAAQAYGSKYFARGARPGWLVSVPYQFKGAEEAKSFRERLGLMHSSMDSGGKPAIVDAGAEIKPFPINHEDQQFLQTREFEVRQIANILGVPPHKLGDATRTSHSSLEAESKSLLEDSYDPWLVCWECELSSKLLREREKEFDTHIIEFIRAALQQTDTKTETESMVLELNNGGITLNEYRAIKNRPSIGPDGDRHRMPLNHSFTDVTVTVATKPAPPVTVSEEVLGEEPLEETKDPIDDIRESRIRGLLVNQTLLETSRIVSKICHRAKRYLTDESRWEEFHPKLPVYYNELQEHVRAPLMAISLLTTNSTGLLVEELCDDVRACVEAVNTMEDRKSGIDNLHAECKQVVINKIYGDHIHDPASVS